MAACVSLTCSESAHGDGCQAAKIKRSESRGKVEESGIEMVSEREAFEVPRVAGGRDWLPWSLSLLLTLKLTLKFKLKLPFIFRLFSDSCLDPFESKFTFSILI